MSVDLRIFRDIRLWAGLLLVVFQYWILIHPQPPLVDRPVHLVLALLLVFLWNPLPPDKLPRWAAWAIDGAILSAVVGFAIYYWQSFDKSRAASRMFRPFSPPIRSSALYWSYCCLKACGAQPDGSWSG